MIATRLDGKLMVQVEYILWLDEERRRINHADLDDIVFYEDGAKIEIPQSVIRKFEMTGLSNNDFITSGYYLKEEEQK